MADVLLALLGLDRECDVNHSRLFIKTQWHFVLEELLHTLRCRLANHLSLVDLVRDFCCQDGDHYLDLNLQMISTAVHDCMANFRFPAFNAVEKNRATPSKGVLSIIIHLNGCLVASASEPSVTRFSNPLGTGDAPSHS